MPNTNTGTLYVVATPIGNLEDITLRAVRVLNEVDMILCEDTRTTGILLAHYKIKNKLTSYHSHTNTNKQAKIIDELLAGAVYALVSDAGTPGISDPGSLLINEAHKNNITVVPIPGASAVTALISASGITGNQFAFWGFVPQKKGRESFLKNLLESEIPVVIYESNHRILKLFEWFNKNSKKQESRFIVGRELTKMFETIILGTAQEVLNYLKSSPKNIKGEFVIIAQK
ncbi:16S rRNA (cytidine(1402)-2'-O)-methyltransferase [Candidatus Nomurabacteria bacterium RIFCSPHIGHO2_02_FULL_38_15]|uniref:Ribosomal RNA small subunit methyltransferase I n=1 Tax=Candidatus Nomurabacteria bacterium RIFCSPHIGHO2_02_FULL_38_15 TaxID=1801752 RepID=A0A1F6VR65_9BACT|nr:MAG: 16S rRNA (cytidine(1402)-2'-O)-methyltransferase [Candidatus Nomurabacteria bacterium RIFCSPHIGHO2_02_FULL_38_15]